MIAFLVAAQLATSTPCLSVQPSLAFVCVEGGWKPPGHPEIPAAAAPVPPVLSPTGTPGAARFRVGRHYRRDTGGALGPAYIFIAGAGQTAGGVPVLFAECEAVGDGCYAPGYVRLFWTETTSHDWTELP